MLILTSTIIIFMGYQTRLTVHTEEPSPNLLPITPKKIEQWGGIPTQVKIGMYIENFPEFNVEDNTFVVEAIIWFKFDTSLISLSTIEKFAFEQGSIEKKDGPETRLIDDQLLAKYAVRLRFTSNISYKFFPHDDHSIYISLINPIVTPIDLIFQADNTAFSLSKDIFIPEWLPVNHKVRTGYEERILDKLDQRKIVRVPKVIFSIDFQRSGARKILLILFPLFLIFFIGLFAFAFDIEKQERLILSLASGSITSLIAYRFVIQGMSPESGYFVLSDYIYTLLLGLSFTEFIIVLWLVRYESITNKRIVLRGLMYCLFHILLIITWYYLLFIWMGK
jgi:hypothetical protein